MKTIKYLSLLYCLILAIVFNACDSNDDPNPTIPEIAKSIALSPIESVINSSNVDFAFNFLNATHNINGNENFVISPFSMQLALAMTMNGCSGETYDELANVAYPNSTDIESVNLLNEKLIRELANLDEKCNLTIINSIWTEEGESFLKKFKGIMKNYYYAEEHSTSYDTSKNNINDWCKLKTNGLISSLLDKNLEESFGFALINTLYFKGQWREEFPLQSTSEGEFTNISGEIVYPFFMRDYDRYVYYSGNDVMTMIQLSFYNAGFNLSILMPDEGYDLTDMIASLNGQKWLDLLDSLNYGNLNISIPKFTSQSNIDMLSVMKEMGVVKIFNSDREIDIIDNKKIISMITQGCYFDIDESGAKASAATIVVGGEISTGPAVEFHVDRPFVYILSECSTNTILFMGQVTEL